MNRKIKRLSILFIIVVLGVGFLIPTLASAQTEVGIIQQLQTQIEQLQEQFKNLQQQLASVIASVSSNTSQLESVSSTKFSPKDRVRTTDTLRVREAPGTESKDLGKQKKGKEGTVIGGPVFANEYWWWKIDYDKEPDGWSAENWLERVSSPTYQQGSYYSQSSYSTPDNPPKLSSLTPISGPIGTKVTIKGSGFTTSSGVTTLLGSLEALTNTVILSSSKLGVSATLTGVASKDTELVFTVPNTIINSNIVCTNSIPPSCSPSTIPIPAGTYTITVKNGNGVSNSIDFTVTAADTAGPPELTSLSPTSGPIGTKVTIKGSGFTATGNDIHFGSGGGIKNVSSTNNDTTLVFSVPVGVSDCDFLSSNDPCTSVQIINIGTYSVWVTNVNGTSNKVTFAVTDSTVKPVLEAPTVSLSVDTTKVIAGESFTLTVTGASSVGLASVWWWVTDTADTTFHNIPGIVDGNTVNLAAAQGFGSGSGLTNYIATHKVVINEPGTYRIWANSRDGEARQASEGAGMASVSMEVVTNPISPAISTKFSLKDSVRTTANLRVREAPGTESKDLGKQKKGKEGSVIGGPVFADTYWWWKIDYDKEPDGWSAENWLE